MVSVKDLKSEKLKLRSFIKNRIYNDPEGAIYKEWVRAQLMKPMIPSGEMTLERQAGQRDVFRDIELMGTKEISDE